jgi:uncharacterized protein YcbK (DUF882 family)
MADLRFSSQRSLTLPDPFIKRKRARPSSLAAPGLPVMPQPDYLQNWGRLDPRLVALLGDIEAHFGGKAVISSGCRSEEHNRAVGGAPHSFHLTCMAADIVIPGVAPAAIRDYALAMPQRGGVGTYCSTPIVHVDVGPRRQWHWGCYRIASRRNPFDLY